MGLNTGVTEILFLNAGAGYAMVAPAEVGARTARAVAAVSLGRRGAAAFAFWGAAADARFSNDIRRGATTYVRARAEYMNAELIARIMTGRISRGSEEASNALESIWNMVLSSFPIARGTLYFGGANAKLWEVVSAVESKNAWRTTLRYAISLAPPRRYIPRDDLPIRRRVRYLAAANVGYRAAAGGSLAAAGIAALEAVGRLTDHPQAADHAARVRRELGAGHAAWRRPAPAERPR